MKHPVVIVLSGVIFISSLISSFTAEPQSSGKLTPAQIMEAFKKVSTGNLADAVEEATGNPGSMNYDMKPIFKTKIVDTDSPEPVLRGFFVHQSIVQHVCKVTYAPEQTVGYAGRASASTCDFKRTVVVYHKIKDGG